MHDVGSVLKGLLLGRPVRSDQAESTLLPKRLALPVFAADALSSVAYAPDEILLTLALAGGAAVALSPWVGLAVALVLVVVVASYRQTVHAYPSGGGDYEVATANLGRRAGVVVASALLVDYMLTVAVSVSSGAQYLTSVVTGLRGDETIVALVMIALLTLLNLRGVRDSGKVLAVPVYGFITAVLITVVVGMVRWAFGALPQAPSAAYTVVPDEQFTNGLVGAAGVFLVARAFASGSAALTGVEAISNGVPAFRRPKSRNAATTLGVLAAISVTLLVGILMLASVTGVRIVVDPATGLVDASGAAPGAAYVQHPALAQVVSAVFGSNPVAVTIVSVLTGLVLLLAANAAFSGFPILASVLARGDFLPHQMYARGDRLAFSNGIVILAGVAATLVVAFNASVTNLIHLYVVGVFVSFTVSQLGMVRHWTRQLRTETDTAVRRQMIRSRVINSVGFVMTSFVLTVVVVTKFLHGAWAAIGMMVVVFAIMWSIRHHYQSVREEVALEGDDTASALPSRVHAIVLSSRLNRPTMRTLAYARATRPNTLEAVTVAVEPADARALVRQWDEHAIPVPLRVLDSPYRELNRPILTYIRSLRRRSPRDLVVVYIPEFVVGHWWERLLHNNSLTVLRSRLRALPGVVVASVPWQLASATVSGTTGTTGSAWSRVGDTGTMTVPVRTRGQEAETARGRGWDDA